MSDSLNQFIDPCIFTNPLSPSKNGQFEADISLNCLTGPWSLSYNPDHPFEPSSNASFLPIDGFKHDLVSFSAEDSSLGYARDGVELDWSIIKLDPIDNPPQQAYSMSDCVPVNIPYVGEHEPATTIEISEINLPRQFATHDLLRDLSRELPGDPPSKPTPKKRGRRRKRPLSPAAEQLKRQNFLKRNRLAASRCREKQKDYIDGVAKCKDELEAANILLKAEYKDLQREIDGVMKLLLECEKCSNKAEFKSFVKENGIEVGRFGTLVYSSRAAGNWERVNDEDEDCDKSTRRSSIFSSGKELDSNSSNASPQHINDDYK
jgi:hypothetical protein